MRLLSIGNVGVVSGARAAGDQDLLAANLLRAVGVVDLDGVRIHEVGVARKA